MQNKKRVGPFLNRLLAHFKEIGQKKLAKSWPNSLHFLIYFGFTSRPLGTASILLSNIVAIITLNSDVKCYMHLRDKYINIRHNNANHHNW